MGKRKRYIIGTIILIVAVIGILFQWESKKNSEAKRLEQQKKEEKLRADNLVQNYVEKYCADLEKVLRDVGNSDVEVNYCQCSEDEYSDQISSSVYDEEKFFYYYRLEYSCESLDNIYKEKTKNEDFEPFINWMDKMRIARNEQKDGEDCRHKLSMDEESIIVYITDELDSFDMTILSSSGKEYCVLCFRDVDAVYVDEEVVFAEKKDEEADLDEDTDQENSVTSAVKPSENMGDSLGDSHANKPEHKQESKPSHDYDPYDVYEYDDPDDFADEWAEEFGDGDYEDGYDEAYDYWEDEWEEL